jgi:1-acyl-sn-glycerol-3-phosphate acyltransferase
MGPRVEGFDARSRPLPFARLGWAALNFAQLLFTLTWTAGWITVALLALVLTGGRRWPLRMAARCWAPGLLWGAGARLEVEGGERLDWSRPHLFVANHQSMIDICALFRAVPLPLRFVLKRELARVPFLGWYARAMGMVFVERGGGRATASGLRRAADLVREGASLCAFPEGTRSRDGTVARFRGGVFRIAMEAGAPVVPVAIAGSGAVLPAAGFQVRPGRIRVRIGEPIEPASLPADGRKGLARLCRQAIVELLNQMRASR